jgi:vancomycin resistance protein VanW
MMRSLPVQYRDAGRAALALRKVKVAALGARRLARWAIDPEFAGLPRGVPSGPITHQVVVPITRSGRDPRLEAGKRHNVQLVVAALHGLSITPIQPFSFWRAVGPATASRGYDWGMELRSGCAVPAIGGGICLVTNALFTIAAELGWHLIERHGHSMALGDAHALDATVAFPHVDLRFAPRDGIATLDLRVIEDTLMVAVRTAAPKLRVELARDQRSDHHTRDTRIRRRVFRDFDPIEDAVIVDDHQKIPEQLRTCLDCGETACAARIEIPAPKHPRSLPVIISALRTSRSSR